MNDGAHAKKEKANIIFYKIKLRPEFFISWFTGIFFRFRVGGTKKKRKKSSENDQLTGHFQSFFFVLFFQSL